MITHNGVVFILDQRVNGFLGSIGTACTDHVIESLQDPGIRVLDTDHTIAVGSVVSGKFLGNVIRFLLQHLELHFGSLVGLKHQNDIKNRCSNGTE